MRTWYCAFILLLVSQLAHSQNEKEVEHRIKRTATEFFSCVADINNPLEPIFVETIVDEFGRGGNYFYLNDKAGTLTDFLNDYKVRHLQERLLNHTFHVVSVTKMHDRNSDWRYNVTGRLVRESATGEDMIVRDEPVSILVLYNPNSGNCSIIGLEIDPSLKITYPTERYEYVFVFADSDSSRDISAEGGECSFHIDSRRKRLKEYEGYPNKTVCLEDVAVEYSVGPTPLRFSKEGNMLKGELGQNISRQTRRYDVLLTQKSGKTLTASVIQLAKSDVRFKDFFDFWDREAPMHSVNLSYSLKYQYGLSYMYRFEDSRFSIGALAYVNGGALESAQYGDHIYSFTENGVSVENNTFIRNYEANGYAVTVIRTVPVNGGYSSLADPHGLARFFNSRTLFMAQAGVNFCQWVRFDLGAGAVSKREMSHLPDAYEHVRYSYAPLYDDLPQIADVESYALYGTDLLYRSDIKWDFAFRAGLTASVALDLYNDHYLNFGIGYVVAPMNPGANSLDFHIGYGWNF